MVLKLLASGKGTSMRGKIFFFSFFTFLASLKYSFGESLQCCKPQFLVIKSLKRGGYHMEFRYETTIDAFKKKKMKKLKKTR